MRRTHVSAAWLACLLLLLAHPGAAWCEDPPAGGAEEPAKELPAESPLKDCDDAEAKRLAAEVDKAGKSKDAAAVLPVLEKIAELRHPEFEKPLLKLLKHESSQVATRVAEMWEWRNNKKIASKLWKATYGEKKNDRRYEIKAKVLKSWPRAGLGIADKPFKDVERDWRWIVGNPEPALGSALAAFAEYAGLAKDKRLCRQLAEELDEPGTNVNAADPNNPPQAWWEKRWKVWKEAKPAVVAALRALTGQEFDKTAQARAWFEENERTFGFRW